MTGGWFLPLWIQNLLGGGGTPALSAYDTLVLSHSPVVFLNDFASGATDASGNGIDGTPTGGYTLDGTGLIDDDTKSILLDGSTGYVTLGNPDELKITGDITIELWYQPLAFPSTTNPASATTYQTLIGKGYDGSAEGYIFRIDAPDLSTVAAAGWRRFAAYGSGQVTSSAGDVQIGRPYHMVARCTSGVWDLLIDGVKVTERIAATNGTGAVSTTAPVVIGAESVSSVISRFAYGRFAKVAVYDYALTDAEILSHTVAGHGAKPVAGELGLTLRDGGTISLAYSVTGGTAPYSHQLQRSDSFLTGYTDIGSVVTGASPTFTDATAGTDTPYYQVVTTDADGETCTSGILGPIPEWSALATSYVQGAFGGAAHYSLWEFVNSDVSPANTTGGDPNVFNPTSLNIGQWLDSMQQAGMGRGWITTQHQNGFRLWPSASQPDFSLTGTDWYTADSVNRDIVALWTDGLRSRSMGAELYFSIRSYYYDSIAPSATTAERQDYIETALTELLTDYGTISGLWLDEFDAWAGIDYDAIETLVHGLQPTCVIRRNSSAHQLPSSVDVVTWEETGRVSTSRPPAGNVLPSGFLSTIYPTDEWAYFADETPGTLKTAAEINANKALMARRASAYTLNVSADATGELSAEIVALLQEIGGFVAVPTPSKRFRLVGADNGFKRLVGSQASRFTLIGH